MIRTFDSEILSIGNVNDSVKIFKLSKPEDFEFLAGQYVSISVPFEGKKLRRPYSIASSPKEKEIELCIKIVDGVASNFLKTLKQGDKVELFGPAGKFTIKNPDNEIVFISTGTGITPFRSMIYDLLEKGFNKKIILIYGFRKEDNVLYEKEFSEFAEKQLNFEFHTVLSRPEKYHKDKGHVQDFFEKYIPENFNGDFYLCGLSQMTNAAVEKLKSLGFNEEQIYYEKYD